jgi:hypothetical protein
MQASSVPLSYTHPHSWRGSFSKWPPFDIFTTHTFFNKHQLNTSHVSNTELSVSMKLGEQEYILIVVM